MTAYLCIMGQRLTFSGKQPNREGVEIESEQGVIVAGCRPETK